MNLHDAAQNRNAAKGVLTQENIGFGLTILPPSAFKKPGNPSGLPGFFRLFSGAERPASAHMHAQGAGRPRPLTPPGLGHAFGHSGARRTRRFSGLQRSLQK